MKEKWLKHRGRILGVAALVLVLAAAYWFGGNAPGLQGWSASSEKDAQAVAAAQSVKPAEITPEMQGTSPSVPETAAGQDISGLLDNARAVEQTAHDILAAKTAEQEKTEEKKTEEKKEDSEASAPQGAASRPGGDSAGGSMSAGEKVEAAAELAGGSSSGVEQGSTSYSESQGMTIEASTGKDQYLTDPVPEGKPVPVEPQDAVVTDKACTCTLSVKCDTILQHMDWLDAGKTGLVPADGVIFPQTQVTFYEGESVFNVLQREMKKAGIHMEFENTPIYNSAYIEGINNLYEFDCGELSGWMYQVNGWFPNYGCSRYALQDGDTVEWVYTCDLGIDVGGYYAAAGNGTK